MKKTGFDLVTQLSTVLILAMTTLLKTTLNRILVPSAGVGVMERVPQQMNLGAGCRRGRSTRRRIARGY